MRHETRANVPRATCLCQLTKAAIHPHSPLCWILGRCDHYRCYEMFDQMRLFRTTNPANPTRTIPILNEGRHRVTQRGIGGPAFPKNMVRKTALINTMENGQLDLEPNGPVQGPEPVPLVTHVRTNKNDRFSTALAGKDFDKTRNLRPRNRFPGNRSDPPL